VCPANGPCGANAGRKPPTGGAGGGVYAGGVVTGSAAGAAAGVATNGTVGSSAACGWPGAGGPGGAAGGAPGNEAAPPLLISRNAPRITAAASMLARAPELTMKAKVSSAAPPSRTTESGAMPERPLPSSDSIGEAVSPSDGMMSQPMR
jgi:hypothetical protein